MWGLGGAKKRKCGKSVGFKGTFEGVKRATRTPGKIITEWAGPFRGGKSETFDIKCFVSIFRIVLPT